MFLDVVTKGTTDYSCVIRIVDSTDGTPETGVVFNTSGIDLWYRRPQAAHTSITEATQTESGAHSDGGFVHISDGYYRLDLPDAAVASGVDYVDVGGTVTGMVVIGGRIRLTDVDLDDAVRGGLTALPNANADAAGGLPISDAGGLDLDGALSGNTPQTGDVFAALPTNFSDLSVTATTGRVDVAAIAGTSQTARDIGASVLLSSGTGTGQISLSSGEVTPTAASKTGYRLSATGVDDIFDEPLSGHVTAGSFGAALYVIRSNTAQAGASTTITLDASASATDDYYNNQRIFLVSGTGAGQGTYITDYNGTTKVATVQDTWRTNPSSDSVFVIVPAGGIPGASAPTAADVADAVWDEARAGHVAEGSFGALFYAPHEGTAQAATTSSITLDATGSSSTDDFYNYAFIKIVAGTGAGQSRQISDYNGTTKVATVSLNWTTTPSTDSQYVVMTDFGIDAATVASIADGVWDEARAGHVTAGTFGEYVLADSVRVSGSSAAADGLEAAVSGATPLPSNVTQWLGTAAATPTTAGVPEVDVTYWRGQAVPATTQTGVPEVDITFVGGVAEDLPTATALAAVQTTATAIEVDTQDIQSRLPASLNNGAIVADIQRINDVAVVGDGSATPFTV